MMPTLTIGEKSVEVEKGKRLVLAIEEAGVNIGHRCGGNSRCTTCRVEFLEGEPDTMTRAEYEKLKAVDLLGKARLSCQIVVDHDMSVKPLMLLEDQSWTDTGPTPDPEVKPLAEWLPKDILQVP
jgi:ferredoxin